MTVTALIVAAGRGERLGGTVPKQYREIGGKPVLRWAVEAMLAHPAIRATRVVIRQGQRDLAAAALKGLDLGEFIEGGAERADSVRAGLDAISGDAVLVHDAARPFCPPDVVDRLTPGGVRPSGRQLDQLDLGSLLAGVDVAELLR